MARWVGKMVAATALALVPLVPAHGNEIAISLRAVVEPRCEILDVVAKPTSASSGFQVFVSCNASQFQLSVVGPDGPVSVGLRSASASVGATSVSGNAIWVTPRAPGLHVFDVDLPEASPAQTDLTVQLEGF